MFGIGVIEIIILLSIFIIIFNLLMTFDAIVRPHERFKFGDKMFWIIILLMTNPLITKFFGGTIWLIGTITNVAGSIIYYFSNRYKNPIKPNVQGNKDVPLPSSK